MEKILRSLINDFENVVCTMKELRNSEKITIIDLEGSLEAHKQRKKKKKEEKETRIGGSLTNKGDYCGG